MSAFQVNDHVLARDSVQGLTKGRRYLVVSVHPFTVLGSTYVDYVLRPCDAPTVNNERVIANGHLVLERAPHDARFLELNSIS